MTDSGSTASDGTASGGTGPGPAVDVGRRECADRTADASSTVDRPDRGGGER